MSNEIQLAKVNEEINLQLADKTVANALLATTFKGLDAVNMKKAILEGHIRGYVFKDFLQKDVYAVPFSSGYALVESIGRARKIGARSGVDGKSAPTYEMAADGKTIISCSVTVYKKGGHPGGYTATVFFSEYASNKQIWKEKPRTMIAKVAEMHALRMACPEELSQSYIEEEFDQQPAERRNISSELDELDRPSIKTLTDNKDAHGKEKKAAKADQLFDVAGNNPEQGSESSR